MNLYRELHCENYDDINQQLLQWVENKKLTSSDEFWNPIDCKELLTQCTLFKQWLVDTKLIVKSIAVTVANKFDCCLPHIDTQPARYKLSWPIQNTQGTFNRWYKIKDETKFIKNHLGGKSFSADNLIEIESNEVLRPMIIDAGIPHDVYMSEKRFPRLGLQCQLFNEPAIL